MENLTITQLTEEDIRRIIREELEQIFSKLEKAKEVEKDEFGGVELATERTGYSTTTIYMLTSNREIPFIKKKGKLSFSRKDLTEWMYAGRKKTDDRRSSFKNTAID